MDIKIKNISNNPLPEYATSGAAAMDIRADLSRLSANKNDIKSYGIINKYGNNDDEHVKAIIIYSNSRVLIPTGLFVEIPEGYQISIRSRSGIAFKEGLIITNGVGTIDSDYRGEIMIGLANISSEPQVIIDGERIAQMLLEKVNLITFVEVNELSDTDRGVNGFGSTGK